MKKLILATLAGLLISSNITLAQTTMSSLATSINANLAPPGSYVGIGIGLRPRYLRIENALAELVKQNGGSNITPDMALDATARAALPTLPANATNDEKTKARDAYLRSATYSDDVVAECNDVFAGAPAEHAGIKQFDQIVAVNNKPITGLDAAGLVKLLKGGGAAGSRVAITVLRAEKDGSKSSHTYTIVRGNVVPPIH